MRATVHRRSVGSPRTDANAFRHGLRVRAGHIRALRRGVAVFCQKPLGRTAAEVRAVVEAARTADRLLGVDLSYRFTAGMAAVRRLIRAGALGEVFAADLTFHNAYGPQKPWFFDPALSGGGCLIDLGVHLVDLALWTLDFPAITDISADLFSAGERLADRTGRVEDYVMATLRASTGATVRIACSWNLHAGQDAAIQADFHGPRGGASFHNLDGSFYEFETEIRRGTTREIIASPPDAWGGRAAADWVARLAGGERFSPDAEQFVEVARVLDGIYSRG